MADSGYFGALATLTGSVRDPALELSFPARYRHAHNDRLGLMEWVRSLPGSRFDPATAGWVVTGTGERPQEKFVMAGFRIVGLGESEFAGVTTLDELVQPVTMLAGDGRTVLVRHRLAGFEACRDAIGPAAIWDKKRHLFRLPISDVLSAGVPRAGVVWDQRAIDAAYELRMHTPIVPGLETAASRLGLAVDRTGVEADVAQVANVVGHYPTWWGMPPLAHQVPGALAVAAGHTLLADDCGIGKTVSALLAAAITGSRRTFIVCPPKVVTHWAREVVRSGMAAEDDIVMLWSGSKAKGPGEAKVVVAADSMLTARAGLVSSIADWEPDWLVADEGHRYANPASARTEALLRLRALCPDAHATLLTGTPILSSPHELVSLLEFTGHLVPVFGGAANFLARYCRQDKFGAWHADRRYTAELNRKLNEHVWVRRTKAQVLPNLPEMTVDRLDMVVNLTDYKATHADILERIDTWIAGVREVTGRLPNDEDVAEYVDTAIQFTSWLRRAAGKAKVPQVTEMVREHLEDTAPSGTFKKPAVGATYERPLIVWAHHKEVVSALLETIPCAKSITGGTTDKAAQALIDAFQRGEVPVLVCSITAVGAGVTLTRGSDAIFAEMDWTPAMMRQAVDRNLRIGQKNAVTVRVAVAQGTLDEHIVRVLGDKAFVVGSVLGDTTAEQFMLANDDAAKMTPAKLVRGMIAERIEHAKTHALVA